MFGFKIPEFDKKEYLEKEAQKKVDEIMKELEKIKRNDYDTNIIVPVKLEIDNEENGHIDFIHIGAKLRARNYRIDICDIKKTKKIASHIIPKNLNAISSIVGITSLQLYTTFQTSEIKFFRECFFNLKFNDYYFSPPNEVTKTFDKSPDSVNGAYKVIPEGWTIWDRIEVKGSKTCDEMCQFLENKYKFVMKSIFIENILIYNYKEHKKNKDIKIEEAYSKIIGKPIIKTKKYFNMSVEAFIPEYKIKGKDYKNVMVNMVRINYMFRDN